MYSKNIGTKNITYDKEIILINKSSKNFSYNDA